MRLVSSASRQKRDLNQWYKDIKKQLTSKAHENYYKRLQEITRLVNHKLSTYDTKMNIDKEARDKMWNGIANDIDTWKGVEITACTKQKTNYKAYAITSRNWWNRNKAKVYGNHFFYTIIFVHIKQVVYRLDLPQQEKAFVFVDVFDEILHAKIQFPQTRAQPIIPHQSFIQPNKFKYASIELLKSNGIHWTGKNIEGLGQVASAEHLAADHEQEEQVNASFSSSTTRSPDDGDDDNDPNPTNTHGQHQRLPCSPISNSRSSYYIKDKDRSLKVNNSFMDSLEMLKNKLAQRVVLATKHGHKLQRVSHSEQESKNCKQDRTSTTKVKDEPVDEFVNTVSARPTTPHHATPDRRILPPKITSFKSDRSVDVDVDDGDFKMKNTNPESMELAKPDTLSVRASATTAPSIHLPAPHIEHVPQNLNQRQNAFSSAPTITSTRIPPFQLNQTASTNLNISNINTNQNIGITIPNSVIDVQSLLSAFQTSGRVQDTSTQRPINNSNNNTNTNTNTNANNAYRQQQRLSPPNVSNTGYNVSNQTNVVPTHYGPARGQTNSVSSQRYSPSALPLNFQNAYCSVNTDPVSGQLMLSIHIPVT